MVEVAGEEVNPGSCAVQFTIMTTSFFNVPGQVGIPYRKISCSVRRTCSALISLMSNADEVVVGFEYLNYVAALKSTDSFHTRFWKFS